ncbi:hypothetical protein LPE01_04680 [Lactiplantibacillus pentosus]|jgi:hypothetical protein|nr:hypothetical protein LPE01_04680 [Lactiplantibacillus pentosus]
MFKRTSELAPVIQDSVKIQLPSPFTKFYPKFCYTSAINYENEVYAHAINSDKHHY